MKIMEVVLEPSKIYTNSKFKLKIKASGITKAYRYKDYSTERFNDYTEEKYNSIKKWEEF